MLALLLFLTTLAAPAAQGCAAYAKVAAPVLAEASFEKEGYETLAVEPPTAAESEAILAALTVQVKHGVVGAKVENGRLNVVHPLKDDPVHGPALVRLETYLNELYLASRAKLRAMPNPLKFDGPRVEIRFSLAGEYHPTAYDRGHVDGGYASTVVSLVGPGTVILPTNTTTAQLPVGAPGLIMGKAGSGYWKIPGTWHRAPPLEHTPPRLFVQFVF